MKFEVEFFATVNADNTESNHKDNCEKGRILVDAYTKDTAVNKAFTQLKSKYKNIVTDNEKSIKIISAKRIR